jgi:hypothetical protein
MMRRETGKLLDTGLLDTGVGGPSSPNLLT